MGYVQTILVSGAELSLLQTKVLGVSQQTGLTKQVSFSVRVCRPGLSSGSGGLFLECILLGTLGPESLEFRL